MSVMIAPGPTAFAPVAKGRAIAMTLASCASLPSDARGNLIGIATTAFIELVWLAWRRSLTSVRMTRHRAASNAVAAAAPAARDPQRPWRFRRHIAWRS
jgi:hypothetical protein